MLGGATTAFLAGDLNSHVDVSFGAQPDTVTATRVTVQQEAKGPGQMFIVQSSWIGVAPSADVLVRWVQGATDTRCPGW